MQQGTYGGQQPHPPNQSAAYQSTPSPHMNQPPQWSQQSNQQQWNLTPGPPPPPATAAYTPSSYGAMSGAQQHSLVPPPPPPKPVSRFVLRPDGTSGWETYYSPSPPGQGPSYQSPAQGHQQPAHYSIVTPPTLPQGYQTAVQQNQQGWPQHPQYSVQPTSHKYDPQNQTTQNTPPLQPSHGAQSTSQPTYTSPVPPPASQNAGSSYYPTAQIGHAAGAAVYNPSGQVAAPQGISGQTFTPNAQQPAYIPPSLSGQGVAAYIPANTNPIPGVFVPSPPNNVPAWEQQQHAPLAGKKFKYTKLSQQATIQSQSSSGYHGYQANPNVQQSPSQHGQPIQTHSATPLQQVPFTSSSQPVYQQATQYGQVQSAPSRIPQQIHSQPSQTSYTHQSQPYLQQQPVPTQMHPVHSHGASGQFTTPQSWPATATVVTGQSYVQSQTAPLHTPTAIQVQLQAGSTSTQSQQHMQSKPFTESEQTPVSPISHRDSIAFGSQVSADAPRGSDSTPSISIRSFSVRNGPISLLSERKPGTPSAFALGAGGPSDWEHFAPPSSTDESDASPVKESTPTQELVAELPAHNSPPPERQAERLQSGASVVSEVQDWSTPPAPPPLTIEEKEGPKPVREAPHSELDTPTPPQVSQNHSPTSSQRATPALTHQSTLPPPATSGSTTHFVMDDGGWLQQGVIGVNESHAQAKGVLAAAESKKARAVQTPGTTKDSIINGADVITPVAKTTEESISQTPVLLEGLDPWYMFSHERYVAMLRLEADAPSVGEKMKIFKDFVTNEARARGINFPPISSPTGNQLAPGDKEEAARLTDVNKSLESENKSLNDRLKSLEASHETAKSLNSSLEEQLHATSAAQAAIQVLENENSSLKEKLEDAEISIEALKGASASFTEKFQLSEKSQEELKNSMKLLKDQLEASEKRNEALNVENGTLKEANSTLQKQLQPTTSSPPGSQAVIASTVDKDTSAAYRPYRQSIALSDSEASPLSSILTAANSAPGNERSHQAVVSEPGSKLVKEQSAYKPYVPVASSDADYHSRYHSGSISGPSGPPIVRREHEEIFIDTLKSGSPEDNYPPLVVPIGQSKAFSSSQTSSDPAQIEAKPLLRLEQDLPGTITTSIPGDERLERLLKALPTDTAWINSLHQKFEAAAARTRAENDKARHRREQESEKRPDQLYNDQEIGYGDIGTLEESFKAQEEHQKRQEERQEYNNYISHVFEPVFGRLQHDVSNISNVLSDAKELVEKAYAGKKAICSPSLTADDDDNVVELRSALDTLLKIQKAADHYHNLIAAAISDRDKRAKRIEIAALYAAGDVAKLKAAEIHFDHAAKVAAFNAARDNAIRMKELLETVGEAVIRGVGQNESCVDTIINLLQDARAQQNTLESESTRHVLDRSLAAVQALAAVSQGLMTTLSTVELALSDAEYRFTAAQAKASGAPVGKLKELEDEMKNKNAHSTSELKRRLALVEEGCKAAKVVVDEISSLHSTESAEERERQERLKVALEEARRRNGENR